MDGKIDVVLIVLLLIVFSAACFVLGGNYGHERGYESGLADGYNKSLNENKQAIGLWESIEDICSTYDKEPWLEASILPNGKVQFEIKCQPVQGKDSI